MKIWFVFFVGLLHQAAGLSQVQFSWDSYLTVTQLEEHSTGLLVSEHSKYYPAIGLGAGVKAALAPGLGRFQISLGSYLDYLRAGIERNEITLNPINAESRVIPSLKAGQNMLFFRIPLQFEIHALAPVILNTGIEFNVPLSYSETLEEHFIPMFFNNYDLRFLFGLGYSISSRMSVHLSLARTASGFIFTNDLIELDVRNWVARMGIEIELNR